jgi:LytS/YehU family sensor histidine kinase
VFPRLGGGSFVKSVVVQGLVSSVAFVAFSILFAEVFALIAGRPSLFGVATVGREIHLVVTPQLRRIAILLPVIPSLLLTLLGYHQYWWRILALQGRERELQALAATAQREALRAQMNPHFLFNALNSIAQLIRVDPDRAEVCVERLAEMFRYVLRRAETELVPLAEELEMAAAYLEIERARFGERLRVETAVDADTLRRTIPNLVLQPLVENAVKHGLSRKVGVGTVRIEAVVADGLLLLTVRDDGLGMAPPALAEVYERGIGLRNLRDRLERLYGVDYRPEISSQPGRGTAIRLRLPVRPLDAAA